MLTLSPCVRQVLDMVDAGVDVDSFISAQQRLDLYAKHVRCSLDAALEHDIMHCGAFARRLRLACCQGLLPMHI